MVCRSFQKKENQCHTPQKTIAKYYNKFGGESAVVSQSIQIISRSSSYFLYKLLLLLWVDPKLSWITRVAMYVSQALKSTTLLKKNEALHH